MTFLRFFVGITFAGLLSAPVCAQTNAPLSGVVANAMGAPIAGATVLLRPANATPVRTDAHGEFSFSNLPAGSYEVIVSKGGFQTWAYGGLTVPIEKPLNVILAASTLDTMKQIVVVRTSAGSSFNTSASAIQTLSQQSFVDQGQLQIGHVLDQIPGVVSARPDSANAAAPGSITSPNLRGALDYEKSTLIDGHPLINGGKGDYPTMLVNSLLFNDIEVVKGPTAYANEINYGIGGTLNFVTGSPTLTSTGVAVAGFDNQSGSFGEMRFSDTVANGRLGYLVSLVRYGTDGPLDNVPTYVTLPYSKTASADSQIGGVALGAATTSGSAPKGYSGPYPIGNAAGNPTAAYSTLVACCQYLTSSYQSNGELAKLAYHFSNVTTLTAGYIGIQGQYDGPASSLTQIDSTFVPGASFGPGGGALLNGGQFLLNTTTTLPNQNVLDNEPMFEGELRTGLGNDTFLARYYSAVLERQTVSDDANPLTGYTLPLQLFGTAKLNGATQSFTGQTENVTIPAANAYTNNMGDHDYLHGSSFEYDHPIGDDLVSAAVDLDTMLTDSYKIAGGSGATQYSIAPGTRQDFNNFMQRGVLQIGEKGQLTLANYYNVYRSTYSPTSSTSNVFNFSTTTTTHDDPRLGYAYRASPDVSIRFSAGSSIAPPYPSLIDNNTQTPASGTIANGTNTISQNSGTIKPETSFAYDLGTDARLPEGLLLSADVYLTNIWNQFATSITDTGTKDTNGNEIFISTNENLAQSRYQGLELSLRKDPPVGYGFTLAGDLARAYAYNISGNFYDSAAGIYTTNLAVVPGDNYYSNGTGYNGISNKSEAYSMGYFAVHRRGSWGQFAQLGFTYYGSNNTFNMPAYIVGSATLRQPVSPGTAIQVSADNVFGSNALRYVLYGINSGAIPAPLVPGANTGGASPTPLGLGLRGDVPYGPTTLRVMVVKSLGK